MTNNEFNEVVVSVTQKLLRLSETKGEEYARGDDRLSNFKRAAILQNQTPEESLRGMLTKHIVSVLDGIDDIAVGTLHDDKYWDEKIMDVVVYMVLLKALVMERNQSNE